MLRFRAIPLYLFVLLLFLFASAARAAGVTATTLPNGLQVLIEENHAAPVVCVDVWYHVGSRNEHTGQTGISHLLEHMTFRGTDDFSKEAMRDLINRNGAQNNGETYYDYTHYFTTIASDRMDDVLRQEASRMSNATLAQSDLDLERPVVESELEGNENDPGRLLFQETMASAFRAAPYHWPVVGYRADLDHVTAATLQVYYHTYYAPNNATLVIVGDVNADDALAAAKARFGRLRRAPDPPQWTTPEPPQSGERRVTVHQPGSVPMDMIVYHVPAITHADTPALLVLEQVLGEGRSSRLYQALVEKRTAVSAWGGTLLLKDSGLFYVGGAASPGGDITAVEKGLLAEVERAKTVPPTAAELARAVRQVEASLIYGRDSVSDEAEQLGEATTETGDPHYLDTELAKVRAVSAADVMRVAATYLTADNRTVGTYEPTEAGATPGGAGGPGPLGYHPTANGLFPLVHVGYEDPAPPMIAGGPPSPAATGQAGMPVLPVKRTRIVLPNGMVLLVQENHANATVAVSASLRAGKGYDPAGKTGTADMVANLLDHGTATRTSNDIAGELEGAAATLDSGTGWETVGVNGHALSGDLELLLRNMADILRNPAFPADELEKMREQALAGLAMDREDPAEAARRAFYRAALPVGDPYRLASFDEEEAGLKALTRDDLVAFHAARYTPKTMILAVVGDVDTDAVQRLVTQYFGDWQGATPQLLAFTPAPLAKAGRMNIAIAGKSEAEVYAGYAGGLTRTDPDYYSAQIMNMILGGGGALNSRLGDAIRDQRGLAYSLYSEFHASTGAGPWYVEMGVHPADVDKAVSLLMSQVQKMHDDGATQQEVDDAEAYLSGAYAITLVTNSALAQALMDGEYFSLGLDSPEQIPAHYRAVTRDQVNAAAKKYLHPEALVTVVAGPGAP